MQINGTQKQKPQEQCVFDKYKTLKSTQTWIGLPVCFKRYPTDLRQFETIVWKSKNKLLQGKKGWEQTLM